MFCCFENDEIVINDGDDGQGEERSATPSNASFAVCVHLCQIEFWINKVELKSLWQKTIHGTQNVAGQQQQQRAWSTENLVERNSSSSSNNSTPICMISELKMMMKMTLCLPILYFTASVFLAAALFEEWKIEKERNSNWKKGRLPRLSPSSSTWNVTSWHSATARGR